MNPRPVRRSLLSVASNPDPQQDCLIDFRAAVGTARLSLRLIPDRQTPTADGIAAWLAALPADASLEALAVMVLDDLNDVLVPRWLSVALQRTAPLHQRVVIEDRQPGWDNPALLARLRPL